LRLIESGKNSTSEGLTLLNSLDKTPQLPPKPQVPPSAPLNTRGRWLRIGQRYAPELNGIDWDSLLTEIQNGANGKLVEVEDQEDNERVEIFVD
jgi:hypothetical protein